jgi:hypothetical protein
MQLQCHKANRVRAVMSLKAVVSGLITSKVAVGVTSDPKMYSTPSLAQWDQTLGSPDRTLEKVPLGRASQFSGQLLELCLCIVDGKTP